MWWTKKFRQILPLIAALAVSAPAFACTGIKLVAKDGTIVSGRTLEFGIKIDADIAVIPRGHAFFGSTPQGKGLAYRSKYAAVGAMAFNTPALMDGLNEKGLSVGTFYFPGYAGYSAITADNQQRALSPVEFPHWILTQFATIDEVKTALPQVVIAPTVSPGWGSTPPPFHYLVTDKEGNGLVIEPMEGKFFVYDNKIGTFTNSPTFDWHMTNLRNFINLTPFNTKPITIDGIELTSFGQGGGMVGLPGDFTPPSRFIRAVIFSTTAIPAENSREAVTQAFHILNQFDIPIGSARALVDGTTYSDSTQITVVRDPQTLRYYFKTYDDQGIKMVDLKRFDLDSQKIKRTKATGSQTIQEIQNF